MSHKEEEEDTNFVKFVEQQATITELNSRKLKRAVDAFHQEYCDDPSVECAMEFRQIFLQCLSMELAARKAVHRNLNERLN